jgi:SEC-C motif-containing protein
MKSTPSELCPCGSGRAFTDCCGLYLSGAASPPSAEALMRSRYAAYARHDAAYLLRTWHPATRPSKLEFDPELRWLELRVLRSAGGAADQASVVHFRARYKLRGKAGWMEEISRFSRLEGEWVYVDGGGI